MRTEEQVLADRKSLMKAADEANARRKEINADMKNLQSLLDAKGVELRAMNTSGSIRNERIFQLAQELQTIRNNKATA